MSISNEAFGPEAQRLRALHSLRILDTSPERFTESVVVAAAAIANTPISAVSLIDTDRQWFKASVGLNTNQTSRQVSFCAHAILQQAPFIVPDAWLDPRFAANPLVTGDPHIRFYAGFPLVVEGHALGTLCIIDDRVRKLSAEQIERLGELALGTTAWLTLRFKG